LGTRAIALLVNERGESLDDRHQTEDVEEEFDQEVEEEELAEFVDEVSAERDEN
jgi:hypothetical protein